MPSSDSPLVLVVDDDMEGREMYAATLLSAGFTVEEASDGFEATDKGFKLRPDVILMDLLMPRLDGWDVVGWLKQNRLTRDIPVVAVTGAGPEEIDLARKAGCAAILMKPITPEALIDEIHRVLTTPGP